MGEREDGGLRWRSDALVSSSQSAREPVACIPPILNFPFLSRHCQCIQQFLPFQTIFKQLFNHLVYCNIRHASSQHDIILSPCIPSLTGSLDKSSFFSNKDSTKTNKTKVQTKLSKQRLKLTQGWTDYIHSANGQRGYPVWGWFGTFLTICSLLCHF